MICRTGSRLPSFLASFPLVVILAVSAGLGLISVRACAQSPAAGPGQASGRKAGAAATGSQPSGQAAPTVDPAEKPAPEGKAAGLELPLCSRQEQERCRRAAPDSPQRWLCDNSIALSSPSAESIAKQMSGLIDDVSVRAVCKDLLLILPPQLQPPAKGTKAKNSPAAKDDQEAARQRAESVARVRDLIALLDQRPTTVTGNHVIQLYNNRDASEIAKAVDGIFGANQHASSIGSDQLLITGVQPPDERAIHEIRRYVSQLDLPRPQVLLNVWSLQLSGKKAEDVDDFASGFEQDVQHYNQQLEQALQRAWNDLSSSVSEKGYFDGDFRSYVSERYIACDVQTGARRYATDSSAQTVERCLDDTERARLNACASDRYCLGYSEAFSQSKPTLTGLLFRLAAASDNSFKAAADRAITAMEGGDVAKAAATAEAPCNLSKTGQLSLPKFHQALCELSEERRRALRAALLDFLFHYKWAVEYPHDFAPFDLPRSANALDSQLAPLVDAFNQDVAAQLDALRKKEECKLRESKQAGKLDFISGGVIRVASLSGQQAQVITKTQSAFDATPPFTFADYLKALQANKDVSSATPANILFKNITPAEAAALAAALSVQKPATALIGRGLQLTVTPTSLATASSAELNVKLTANEDPCPKVISDAGSKDLPLNRVAEHTVEDVVRVETLKLFEISSFSAELGYQKPKFVVPMVGELPIIGPFFRFRRGIDTSFHRSFAVVTAFVAPTARDLADSIRFDYDRQVTHDTDPANGLPRTTLRLLNSASDLPVDQVQAFHRAEVECTARQFSGNSARTQFCGEFQGNHSFTWFEIGAK